MEGKVCDRKRIISLLAAFALAVTAFCAYGVTSGEVNAASKAKTYALPSDVYVHYYGDNRDYGMCDMKYDKFGNLTKGYYNYSFGVNNKIKYRNKKGKIASVTEKYYGEKSGTLKKTYDKKGRLTKVKTPKATFKYTVNKKGIIKKVTRNGKLYYSVKSIKYHKNGVVYKVVYNNGDVNYYNSNGLLTKLKVKKDATYTYKYTKKNGKVVKAIAKRNGKKYAKISFYYDNSATTKNVWLYSAAISAAGGGPSNVFEIYAKSAISGEYLLY